MRRVCVNCGSNAGRLPDYVTAARRLGECLAGERIEIVYGGANVGLMGALADAALTAGGHVIGVVPRAIADRVGHQHLSELRIVDTMHERKSLMVDLADAFIALPGGFRTLEEVFEVLTWAQLGLHTKPCGLLNTAGYYDRLLRFLDHAVREGFVRQEHRRMLLVSDTAEDMLRRLRAYRPPTVEKWISRPPAAGPGPGCPEPHG